MMSASGFHVLGHFGSGAGETTIDMSMSPSSGGGSFQPFPGGAMEVSRNDRHRLHQGGREDLAGIDWQ